MVLRQIVGVNDIDDLIRLSVIAKVIRVRMVIDLGLDSRGQ